MPVTVYNELSAVAEERGVDLSAVLNWICVEQLPHILRKEAERKQALLQATAAKVPNALASEAGTGEALGLVRELLKQMQDVYAGLSKRALEEDERCAG
jgi:hypothetical protein